MRSCQTAETEKRQEKRSMTKKKSSEIFSVKMEIFSEKRSFENFVVEIFFRPPKLGARSPPMKPSGPYHATDILSATITYPAYYLNLKSTLTWSITDITHI